MRFLLEPTGDRCPSVIYAGKPGEARCDLEEGHEGKHDYQAEPEGFIGWLFDRWSPRWRRSRSLLIWAVAVIMILGGVLALLVFILFMISVSGLGP
jgi:hypothetical protein